MKKCPYALEIQITLSKLKDLLKMCDQKYNFKALYPSGSSFLLSETAKNTRNWRGFHSVWLSIIHHV